MCNQCLLALHGVQCTTEGVKHGVGVLAHRHFKPGDRILLIDGAHGVEYIEDAIDRGWEEGNEWTWVSPDAHVVDQSQAHTSSPARYVNIGTPSEINCVVDFEEDLATKLVCRMWMVCSKDIAPGEEVLTTYGRARDKHILQSTGASPHGPTPPTTEE